MLPKRHRLNFLVCPWKAASVALLAHVDQPVLLDIDVVSPTFHNASVSGSDRIEAAVEPSAILEPILDWENCWRPLPRDLQLRFPKHRSLAKFPLLQIAMYEIWFWILHDWHPCLPRKDVSTNPYSQNVPRPTRSSWPVSSNLLYILAVRH